MQTAEQSAFSPRAHTLDELKKAWEGAPQDEALTHQYILTLKRAGFYDEAINVCKAYQTHYPASPFPQQYMGLCYGDMGDIKALDHAFDEAFKLSPTFEVEFNRALAYMRAKLYDRAEKIYKKWLTNRENDANLWSAYGTLLYYMKRFEDSVDAYQHAVDAAPNILNNVRHLASVQYFNLSQYDDAESHFQRLATETPNEPIGWDALARMYFDQHDGEKLTALLKRAEEANIPDVCWQCIATYVALHQYSQDPNADIHHLVKGVSNLDLEQNAAHRSIYNTFLFRPFLRALIKTRRRMDKSRLIEGAEGLPVLYIVGDAHSLPAAHTWVTIGGEKHVMRPKLTVGLTLFSLSNHTTSKVATCFEKSLKSLPQGSPVLLTLGEIDCRLGSGFLGYFQRHPDIDKKAYVEKIVNEAASNILPRIKEAGLTLYMADIPAPRMGDVGSMTPQEQAQVEVIRWVNSALRRAFEGSSTHVPLYEITRTRHGYANNTWHMDKVHLKPSAYHRALEGE